MSPTDHETEIRELYQLARSVETRDPRSAAALAKQILRLDLAHAGAWNLIYSALGQNETVGAFERAFIEYNFRSQREWYEGQRAEHYVRCEQARLKDQLNAWRKLFDDQNRLGFEDFVPGLVIGLLGIVAVAGLFLSIFGNPLHEIYNSFRFEWYEITGGIILLAVILILGAIIIRRIKRSGKNQPMAPQAPANVRWVAIEKHFNQMMDELEMRDDHAISIPPAFSLFIDPTARFCPHCGRTMKGHQCAPMPALVETR